MKNKLKYTITTVAIMFAIIFFINLLLVMGLHLAYADRLPGTPQPQQGRINKITVNHGYIRYVTASEKKWLEVGEGVLPVTVVLAAIAFALKKEYVNGKISSKGAAKNGGNRIEKPS